jgi:hypothetical protein
MAAQIPEKARLLEKLSEGGFNVPEYYYLPPQVIKKGAFDGLEKFLGDECKCHKIIVRSCHPAEEFYKGGTFNSLETYADVGGVKYAYQKIVNSIFEEKELSILRQQKFHCSPPIDPKETGVLVMPYMEGPKVMAKVVGNHWEFGYCRTRSGEFECEPYITQTPNDLGLLQLSQDIQDYLGFKCEIEYVLSPDGQIHVVQAKDISKLETPEYKQSEMAVRLDGLRRIRLRRNYRERPLFVMDNHAFYLDVVTLCEGLVHGGDEHEVTIDDILQRVLDYEKEMNAFALRHERFAVLGLCIVVPDDLYQVANHYLDDFPELQKQLSKVLYQNQYKVDQFLAEADTLIAKGAFRRNLCSHDAYGINTVRNPVWSAYWSTQRHKEVVRQFKELGYETGDYIGIEVDLDERPTVFRF